MTRVVQRLTGFVATLAIVAGAAVLSAWPSYRALPEGMAVVKLSFSHGAPRKCRPMTEDELAKLPPNMRRKEICDRQRPPIYVEFDLDGATILAETLPASGIAGDGPSRIYRSFVVPAGHHEVAIRLRETPDADGFDFTGQHGVDLAPAQSFVIDFRPVDGGFVYN